MSKCVNGKIEESGNFRPKCSYFCAVVNGCEITTEIGFPEEAPEPKIYKDSFFWVEP